MIICEIGQNWCGDIDLAKHLILEAKKAKGDLVKFQLYNHKMLYHDHPEIPDVSLSYDQAASLFQYGRLKGIEVFFSVFDLDKVDWCERIGVKRYKIAKSRNRDRTLIDKLLVIGKPTYISMSGRDNFPCESKYTSNCVFGGVPPYPNFIFMYCVGEYPTPLEKVNFKNDYPAYSDHTIGMGAVKLMLLQGKIVEKHFAIDHKTGVDAEWSMTPSELKELSM